jgi:3-oxoacyl-[acyl-carrier-protein] synthase III
MTVISLVGAASYMPETVVGNEFFLAEGEHEGEVPLMFRGVKQRHHVGPRETAVSMIEKASQRLAERLNLDLARDVDVLLTNVTVPDMPFMGCGASLGHALGIRPKAIFDLHNGGCVAFVVMLDLVKSLMTTHGYRTALLCNVQNAGGRLFSQGENRVRKQARIPGDGCGVGYVVANAESPVRSIVVKNYGEYAADMTIVRDDDSCWWEPSDRAAYVDFNETKIAMITNRANRIVPDVLKEACARAEVSVDSVGTLITNQPNRLFLRNWREALQLPPGRQVQTFERHGNLFGAALPVCLDEAISTGQLKSNSYLLLGGFSHAGDYAAAALVHWKPA